MKLRDTELSEKYITAKNNTYKVFASKGFNINGFNYDGKCQISVSCIIHLSVYSCNMLMLYKYLEQTSARIVANSALQVKSRHIDEHALWMLSQPLAYANNIAGNRPAYLYNRSLLLEVENMEISAVG